MITVKNVSSATVVLSLPDLRFRRELVPGRIITISQEEYDNMMFDPGINVFINDHTLEFKNTDDTQTIPQQNIVEPAQIRKMLEELDITSFAKFIPTAAEAEKETVVKFAVDMGITNPGFVALIKKYCDVDIINAINTKHLVEN